MITIYYENKRFANQIEYAFESLFRCIGIYEYSFNSDYLGNEDIVYAHSVPSDFKGVFIGEGNLFNDSYMTNKSVPVTPLRRNDQEIPILFDSYADKESNKSLMLSGNDIIQGCFFILSGMEEAVCTDSSFYDVHGRFKMENRILFKENCFSIPLVNEYARELLSVLGEEDLSGEPLAVISHDMDLPYKEYNFFQKVLNRLNIPFNKKEDPYIEFVLGEEKKLGISSSWYIMTANHSHFYDGKYNCKDNIIAEIITKIKKSGCEVGFHYGYEAAENESEFRKQVERFCQLTEQKTVVGRNHYLRYKVPESFITYKDNNIYYDSTLGAAGMEGFIWGTCTPFKLFDLKNGVVTDVWEIPLIVMEATLFQKSYRGLSFDESIVRVKELISQVIKYNGVFSILWHSSSFEREACYKGIQQTYIEIMRLISDSMRCVTGTEAIERFEGVKK